MSAESPRRSRTGGPLIVPPQPPCDRTLMDTVSGFINDVTLASNPNVEPKDIIQWARFENADINEPKSDSDGDGDIQPLLLIIGYGSGIQVWIIQPGGEAQEALSWRQGSVRVLRILPTPSYGDYYAQRRPLIALCDSTGPGVPYCSLSFISLSGGDQVKSIKFKNPILDVVANKRSIVVAFSERLAVFDACKLEDRLTVTTCYPSPCPLGGSTPANPVTLGDRWLAYAERRLSPTKKSCGGCEGEGVASYTATVLHAAKSLGKGLRGLGESVASSLGGVRTNASQSPSPPNSEQLQPGVVTVVDLENWKINDEENPDFTDDINVNDSVVAHFVAHSEPVVALKFDASGMLIVTADKRGHDFHVFRIHPHPNGPHLASVHHLYILHRGDTTAKVQNISISFDSRWVAVSTLRGTTHVFPITPYGGAVGVRTHASPHVVNRLSRFHRSAGLAADGRSNSPVGENIVNGSWYPNPRLPPFPAPATIHPLAQLRPTPATGAAPTLPTHTITRNSSGRQRLSSLSEEGQLPLVVCAKWGAIGRVATGVARARGLPSPPATQALYVMSAHGNLIQYYINPKHASGIPKEKVCDDTLIELEVEAKAQWPLVRPSFTHDIIAPLPPHHILLKPMCPSKTTSDKSFLDTEDRWLSQVEIMTHAGPHRRLWMGPQFVFKTYNASGTSFSLLDYDAVEVGTGPSVARSNPMNMPGGRPIVPVLIESGSASSLEHSPRLSDAYRRGRESVSGRDGEGDCHREGEVRLKEDLAEAMRETDQGYEWALGSWSKEEDSKVPHVHRIVNPLGTVVSGASSSSPSPPSEGDSYILSNEDEALFRPVVRAPRSLPAPATPPTRPLSSRTLLPAQHVSVSAENTSTISTVPATTLNDRIVIPAKLSYQCSSSSSMTEEKTSDESKINKQSFSKIGKKKRVTKCNEREDTRFQKEENEKMEHNNEVTLVEFSKASEEIQYCNNEVVGNLGCEQNIHITAYRSEDILGKCDVNIADIHKCENIHECAIESFPDRREEKPECFEFEYVKNIENEKYLDNKNKQFEDCIENKDEPWEILLNGKREIPETFVDKLMPFNDNSIETLKSCDDIKPRMKKNKKNKSKFRNVKSESPTKDIFVKSEIIMNSTEKEALPISSFSWSETAITENKDFIPSSFDTSYSDRESNKYSEKNIVVALCDSPEHLELCFTEKCAPFSKNIFEDKDVVSMGENFLEFLDMNEKDGYDNAIIENEISVINKNSEQSTDNNASEKDDMQCNDCEIKENESFIKDTESKSNALEKSSDEENVSSQAESDDGTQVIALDKNIDIIDEVQIEASTLVSVNPIPAKSKKKPKRKRGAHSFDNEQEDLSSSSFSSASRASLDPPSSPTPSCSGDNILHFPGDSSGSV